MNTNFKKIKTDWHSILMGFIIIAIVILMLADWNIRFNNANQKEIALNKSIQNETEQGYKDCLIDINKNLATSIETCKPLLYYYVYPANNLTYQINFISSNCLNVTR